MATATQTRIGPDRRTISTAWRLTITAQPETSDRVGDPIPIAGYSAASVQLEGTFGADTTLAVQLSNDGANFHDLFEVDPAIAGLTPFTPTAAWLRVVLVGVEAADATATLVVQ